jgi:tetratricopeptide (TPR) repeat protein
LGNSSADQFFPRTPRTHPRSVSGSRSRSSKAKAPSSTGYLIGAILGAILLFLLLWWLLVTAGDEAPWLPAGLVTAVFLLIALSAREVLMRRAWTRYLLENGIKPHSSSRSSKSGTHKRTFSLSVHSAALRAIQKQSAAADRPNTTPEAHLDVALLCQDFLAGSEDVLRSGNFGSEKTIALKAGQERVRALHRHHLLIWARDQSRLLTHEAQQKARIADKIETANKALECIDSALVMYPTEVELNESKAAIREFIASVRVAHWVELAERSAFKGHYRRAIDRYKDALFYLNDEAVKDDVRNAGTKRIEGEIGILRERLRALHRERQEARDNEDEASSEDAS